MEQIKNIIHRHGLAVMEMVEQAGSNSPVTGFSLEMFVPSGSALIVLEEIGIAIVNSTFKTARGKEHKTTSQQSKRTAQKRVISDRNEILCNLESFGAKLRLPTMSRFQLVYSAVIVAPDDVIQIRYEVAIDPNFGTAVEETAFTLNKWPPIDQEKQQRLVKELSGF